MTKSSGKKADFTPEVKQKFDGLLDLISEKNVKIGKLVIELDQCRATLEKTLDSVLPSVRRLVENRIRNAEEVLRMATR